MGKPRIANLHELTRSMERSHGDKYASTHYALGSLLGAQKLGFNLTVIPPGKVGFPYHFHHVNEELFVVLEGTGSVRSPDGEHPLKEGDVLCCPPGAAGAHQIFNTGDGPLRYIALSTREQPEIVEYPDSGKYAATTGIPPGGTPADATFRVIAFTKDAVDYWEGED